jgi:hypothetical protein
MTSTTTKKKVKFRPLSEKEWGEMNMTVSDFKKKEETSTEIHGEYLGNYFSILKSSLND